MGVDYESTPTTDNDEYHTGNDNTIEEQIKDRTIREYLTITSMAMIIFLVVITLLLLSILSLVVYDLLWKTQVQKLANLQL